MGWGVAHAVVVGPDLSDITTNSTEIALKSVLEIGRKFDVEVIFCALDDFREEKLWDWLERNSLLEENRVWLLTMAGLRDTRGGFRPSTIYRSIGALQEDVEQLGLELKRRAISASVSTNSEYVGILLPMEGDNKVEAALNAVPVIKLQVASAAYSPRLSNYSHIIQRDGERYLILPVYEGDLQSLLDAPLFMAHGLEPRHVFYIGLAESRIDEDVRGFFKIFREENEQKLSNANSPDLMVPAAGDQMVAAKWDGQTTSFETRFAPRICAPRRVDYLTNWGEGPQTRYIFSRYWQASKKAIENLDRARSKLESYTDWLDEPKHPEDVSRIFDDFSGAVCFLPGQYQFEVREQRYEDEAAEIWRKNIVSYFEEQMESRFTPERPFLKRRLYSNSLVLLRGDTYYSNLKLTSPWAMVNEYLAEIKSICELINGLISETHGAERVFDFCASDKEKGRNLRKLILGLMDQVRNIGLLTISGLNDYFKRHKRLNGTGAATIRKSCWLVRSYYMVLLSDEKTKSSDFWLDITIALHACMDWLKLYSSQCEKAWNAESTVRPENILRGWREADHPLENLWVALSASEVVASHPAAAIGIFWGGTELPIVLDYIAERNGNPLKFFGHMEFGGYSSHQNADIQVFCDYRAGVFEKLDVLKEVEMLALMDDNALSGKTLEACRNLLLSKGVDDVKAFVTRFSGERREGQIRMSGARGKGIVDPEFLVRSLKGYVGETRFSRSYSTGEYTSPTGVFNLARSRILKYLHENTFSSLYEREGF
ncbi:hypothetical protein HFN01_19365 [Rhizobium leguminosarum]|uniref:hypothetical protein n=1 Tax=Rhizobium leguminosarum TaxID=384 RepID=UPI001C98C16B|nr:hypothetical protein [Rhizobium leguminosarum]MBY5396971.1 hypothetical protein [Rhizobium leguminosarum]